MQLQAEWQRLADEQGNHISDNHRRYYVTIKWKGHRQFDHDDDAMLVQGLAIENLAITQWRMLSPLVFW